ncbi:ATP synthase gamma chain [Sporomusa acidovorans DSM 3132]|uniref:ATP synthase gamma chain n=1 Tax=Sporomusa acidovorans (strain ATCC 49682 / DSM 3132 / Mol) TaxID=1123286 RepID=A0ABZ3J813_SPOA4|nr:ATP synthase F1 subunit gamma [Sporomusa acidovorans]OZC15115.1 ATP synthase gamma chain [Sporomusa acidovorans DSM 3132]
MANARDIRRRIKSVKNIQQITKAMKMVAAARLRRAQERAIASKPYTGKIREVLAHVALGARDAAHPLLAVRDINTVGHLVLSADKGLAGAYSSNLIKQVLPYASGKNNVRLITVGRKARDYFKRRGYRLDGEYTGFSEKPAYQDAVMLARLLSEKYQTGEYDEIYLTYTHFQSPINQTPTTIKLLPVAGLGEGEEQTKTEYIFEPSAHEVLSLLLPRYLETVIYGALLQSAASELGARMTAMGSATDNAQELISKLTLHYNKVRQATITSEITEIVAGAEALK